MGRPTCKDISHLPRQELGAKVISENKSFIFPLKKCAKCSSQIYLTK